jgi:molybdopterin adenylyltransferase
MFIPVGLIGPARIAYNAIENCVILIHMPVHDHERHARANLKVGVITASDSRSPESDESGKLIRTLLQDAGHLVAHYELIPDDPEKISAALVSNLENLDAIIVNGGTGITARDGTTEVVKSLLDKELEGFGELFRMLSFQEIGAAAMMSRAIAGVRHGKFIAALPGSPDACRLAMEKLLIPQLGHITYLLSK